MSTFVARRLLALVPLLLAATFITQALLVASPGSYITSLYESGKLRPELIQVLEHQYHLESHNLFTRYWYWLWQALHGNFGFSFKYMTPVWGLVWQRLFNTLLLSVAALIISWGGAIPLGTLAAVKRGTWIDRLASFASLFGLSMPAIFLSLLMIMFAAKTGWFPIGGIHSEVYWDNFSWVEKIGDLIWHLALPAIVLGTIGMGQYMRQMRGEMLETLGHDYIRTAVAKGLSRRRVIFKHALGNAINPLVSLFGFSLAYLLAGAILTETVFAWPGMGLLTFEALRYKDEPLVMASVVLITAMLMIGSLASDLLLATIDPRVRLEGQ